MCLIIQSVMSLKRTVLNLQVSNGEIISSFIKKLPSIDTIKEEAKAALLAVDIPIYYGAL
jgi:hypothetical protein